VEDADGRVFRALPFFGDAATSGGDEARRYDVEGSSAEAVDGAAAAATGPYVGRNEDAPGRLPVRIRAFDADAIAREMKLATDTWTAPGLRFTIYSPVRAVPDPGTAAEEDLKAAVVPAVLCELTVNNADGSGPRRAAFGFAGNDPYSGMRRIGGVGGAAGGGLVGIGEGTHLAIVSPADPGVTPALGFGLGDILNETLPENWAFGLGRCGVLLGDVPAGETRTFRFAVCFHRDGVATTGQPMRYLYTRFFPTIEAWPRTR
jgi:hypothetical protein